MVFLYLYFLNFQPTFGSAMFKIQSLSLTAPCPLPSKTQACARFLSWGCLQLQAPRADLTPSFALSYFRFLWPFLPLTGQQGELWLPGKRARKTAPKLIFNVLPLKEKLLSSSSPQSQCLLPQAPEARQIVHRHTDSRKFKEPHETKRQPRRSHVGTTVSTDRMVSQSREGL